MGRTLNISVRANKGVCVWGGGGGGHPHFTRASEKDTSPINTSNTKACVSRFNKPLVFNLK